MCFWISISLYFVLLQVVTSWSSKVDSNKNKLKMSLGGKCTNKGNPCQTCVVLCVLTMLWGIKEGLECGGMSVCLYKYTYIGRKMLHQVKSQLVHVHTFKLDLLHTWLHSVVCVWYRYIKEYVTCHTCRSPDTILQKDARLYFLQCEQCNSRCSVAPIKSGFQVSCFIFCLCSFFVFLLSFTNC